jgi:hypothetical protein
MKNVTSSLDILMFASRVAPVDGDEFFPDPSPTIAMLIVISAILRVAPAICHGIAGAKDVRIGLAARG